MSKIEVLKNGKLLGTLELTPDELSIGRGPTNRLIIRSPVVSRRHARVVCEDGKFLYEDLGSAAGSLIDGEAIRKHELADGDEVQIGDHLLVFRETAVVAGAASEPLTEASIEDSLDALSDLRIDDSVILRSGGSPAPVDPAAELPTTELVVESLKDQTEPPSQAPEVQSDPVEHDPDLLLRGKPPARLATDVAHGALTRLFLSSWHGTLLSRALALGKVSLNSEPFCIRVQLTGHSCGTCKKASNEKG